MNAGPTLPLRRELIPNFAAIFSSSALERGILAVTVMIVARMVGPDGFGPYAASFAVVRILAVAFALGLDTWLLRNGYREHDRAKLAQHATTCIVLKGTLGAAWLLVMIAVSSLLNSPAFPPLFILLSSLIVYFEEIASSVWSASRAALQNQRILKLIVPANLALLAVVVSLALLGTDDAAQYLFWQMFVTAGIAVLAITWQAHAFGFAFDRASYAPTLRGTFVFGVSMGLFMIYGRADVALVAQYLGSEAAGYYAPAISITGALALAPFAIYMIMVPVLSREHAQRSSALIAHAKRLLIVSIPLGILAGLFLMFSADWIVQLVFGSAYTETGDVLTILGGVLSARFITLAAASILVAVGWQYRRVQVQAVVATANVGLNILLIPIYGIIGAASVYVFTEWTLVIGYLALTFYWLRAYGSAYIGDKR